MGPSQERCGTSVPPGLGNSWARGRASRWGSARLGGLILAGFATIACGDQGTTGVDAGGVTLTLVAAQTEVRIPPNDSGEIAFFLTDAQNAPAPGRIVQFRIDNSSEARGATLSSDRGVTDLQGRVSVLVIAGPPSQFVLRASSEMASEVAVGVFVDPVNHARLEVVPQVLPDTMPTPVAVIKINLLPDVFCATTPVHRPMPTVYQEKQLAPGESVGYDSVSTKSNHALIGHAVDATGVLLLSGCVDLPGATLREEGTMRVVLPLRPTRPSPVGGFSAVSRFQLDEETKPVASIGQAWQELVACERDPGRLWLDCTVDALKPATAEDPLDCIPSAADEAAFDGRLSARRGLPKRDEANPDGRCREDKDGADRAALEVQVAAMFTSQNPTLRTNLEAIAKDARNLLANLRLRSNLTITPTSVPDTYQVDHALVAIELGPTDDPVTVTLRDLGLPVGRARFVPALGRGRELSIAQHGFTLRLGSAARLGFERNSLGKRGYPQSASAFVTSIFAGASYQDRGVQSQGCLALAALVCPLVGAPEGCIVQACQDGIVGLGAGLEQAFAPLDGDDLDFFLQGSAPLIERNDDGLADALGWLIPVAYPGVWSATVRAQGRLYPLSGFFTADRTP